MVGIASDIGRAQYQQSDPLAINHIPLGGRTGKRRRDGDGEKRRRRERERGNLRWESSRAVRQLRKDDRRAKERRGGNLRCNLFSFKV